MVYFPWSFKLFHVILLAKRFRKQIAIIIFSCFFEAMRLYAILDDFEFKELVNKLRRKDYKGVVPFPKTRKFDQDGDLLGFVKLSVEE